VEYPPVIKITKSDGGINLILNILPELEAFKGHFESAPIVPGVVQLQWVIKYAKLYIQDSSSFQTEALEVLKFQNVIQPNTEIELNIKLIKSKLVFAFLSGDIKHSSGKISVS